MTGIFFNVSVLKAAEEPAAEVPATVDEDLEYTYGSVISTSPTEIVVSEYNYETDEEVQMTYAVNPETKFSNVNSPQDLAKDDNVDIYYKVAPDGKKFATMITKDETVYESESNGEDVVDDLPDNTVEPETNATIEIPPATTGNETRG